MVSCYFTAALESNFFNDHIAAYEVFFQSVDPTKSRELTNVAGSIAFFFLSETRSSKCLMMHVREL